MVDLFEPRPEPGVQVLDRQQSFERDLAQKLGA
jgi:hypothetical protein